MKHFKLNFSGDKNSWFDFWHYHPDNDGYGNKDAEQRVRSLQYLLNAYNDLNVKLQQYPHPYQIWILICENDSREDAVYIHTNNPNGSEFPLKLYPEKRFSTNKNILYDFIINTDMEVIEALYDNDKYFHLFKKDLGLPLL